MMATPLDAMVSRGVAKLDGDGAPITQLISKFECPSSTFSSARLEPSISEVDHFLKRRTVIGEMVEGSLRVGNADREAAEQ